MNLAPPTTPPDQALADQLAAELADARAALAAANALADQLAAELAQTRAQLAAELYDAMHDPLTGAFNRRGFSAATAAASEQPAAVAIVDLDNFKPVNDHHGHEAGDAVLIAAARRLTRHVGAGGVVARLGGDEFAVLIPRPDRAGNGRWLEEAGIRLVRALTPPVRYRRTGATLTVTASIGLAPVVDDLTEALRRADLALYDAKQRKGRAVVYNADRHGQPAASPTNRPTARRRDQRRAVHNGLVA